MTKKRKYRRRNSRARWIILAVGLAMSFAVLFYTNKVAKQIRISEQEKITLWANALGHKAQLVNATETFFHNVNIDERRKMNLYIQILKSFNSVEPGSDAAISLAYISYIVDSSKTSFVILNSDSVITNCSNYTGDPHLDRALIGKKMSCEDISSFTGNEPVRYTLWGMPMLLLYKESPMYGHIQAILDQLNESFFAEITNNSVFAPVIVVDSVRQSVIGYGNIDSTQFNTPKKLAFKLNEMEKENDPILLRLANNQQVYVYYETTPLLKQMRYLPFLYFFVGIMIIVVSLLLLRAKRSDNENMVWIGMAKETAHQLGTPISSLMAWVEYLDGKTFEEPYKSEIRKDLNRLDTIARRFSKIGSVPELKTENVCQVIDNTLAYLRPRTTKKIRIVKYLPKQPLYANLNVILFEWVIENICKNAIDAMEGQGTFTITVSSEGKNICIDCSNTGKPIPSKTQKYLFDSGFSTKTRGWGLGLSLAKRIINEYHKGNISLKSSTTEATVFRIVLKRVNADEMKQKALPTESQEV